MTSLDWDWAYAWSIVPMLLSGAEITVVATLAGSLLSFTLGLVWTLLRMKQLPFITPLVECLVSLTYSRI